MISFHTEPWEFELIKAIASRASGLAAEHGLHYPRTEAWMDLVACHANGSPLRLEALKESYDSSRFDFCHDVFGIRKHINRETGQLQDGFSPRFSQR